MCVGKPQFTKRFGMFPNSSRSIPFKLKIRQKMLLSPVIRDGACSVVPPSLRAPGRTPLERPLTRGPRAGLPGPPFAAWPFPPPALGCLFAFCRCGRAFSRGAPSLWRVKTLLFPIRSPLCDILKLFYNAAARL